MTRAYVNRMEESMEELFARMETDRRKMRDYVDVKLLAMDGKLDLMIQALKGKEPVVEGVATSGYDGNGQSAEAEMPVNHAPSAGSKSESG